MYLVCTQSACWNCSSCAILKFVGVVGVGLNVGRGRGHNA